MMSTEAQTKIDLEFADSSVVFGISSCSSHKKHSFWVLVRIEAEEFLGKLRYFEQMTWKQFGALPRENGLTSEIQGTGSYNMIDQQNNSASKLVERRYFHFRVKQKSLFRVLGYQYKNIFYITHLDPKGILHH